MELLSKLQLQLRVRTHEDCTNRPLIPPPAPDCPPALRAMHLTQGLLGLVTLCTHSGHPQLHLTQFIPNASFLLNFIAFKHQVWPILAFAPRPRSPRWPTFAEGDGIRQWGTGREREGRAMESGIVFGTCSGSICSKIFSVLLLLLLFFCLLLFKLQPR